MHTSYSYIYLIITMGGVEMFNLPAETFWWLVPWPFIWVGLALVLYVKLKREDEKENDR